MKNHNTIWASGHHLCGELLSQLEELRSRKNNHIEGVHKEEKAGRIQADTLDRTKIASTLKKCIHLLDVDSHSSDDTLVNIFTGEVSDLYSLFLGLFPSVSIVKLINYRV